MENLEKNRIDKEESSWNFGSSWKIYNTNLKTYWMDSIAKWRWQKISELEDRTEIIEPEKQRKMMKN